MSTTRSCLECRRRKIRCDRTQPCAYCVKNGIECAYPTIAGPSNRRAPRSGPISPSSNENTSRVQQLEEQIEQLGARVSDLEHQQGSQSGAASTTTLSRSPRKQWSSGRQSEAGLPAEVPSGFALRLAPYGETDLPPLTVDVARGLWELYLADIDPCMKIVDHTYVEQILIEYPTISSGDTALLHAICFAATACKDPNAISHYQDSAKALERALQSAEVLTQPSMPTLQALTIYLICGRVNMDQEYLCTMLILLIRLAKKLQLNRDPEGQGFSDADCELRQRLWWYILTLDMRTAEACGSNPFITTYDKGANMPSMVLDASLRSKDQAAAVPHAPCTFFAVMGFEMANAARSVLFPPNTDREEWVEQDKEERIAVVDELHTALFRRYFTHCCCADSPICRLTIQWCSIYWARLKLLVLHSDKLFLHQVTERSERDAEKDLLACVSILERVQEIKADNQYSRWAWLWQNCVEWDASAIALCTIVAGKCTSALVDRAWIAMDSFFGSWSGGFADPSHQRRWRELLAFRDWVRATR